jgi:hypothetical protein
VPQYHTATFSNDHDGIQGKNQFSQRMAQQGWRVASESITQGQMKGGQACCLASICLPMGFLAGRTAGSVMVTYVHDGGVSCRNCGTLLQGQGQFCSSCGAANSGVTSRLAPPPPPPPTDSEGMSYETIRGIIILVVLVVLLSGGERMCGK